MRLTVNLDRRHGDLIDVPISWMAKEPIELVDAETGDTVQAEFAWLGKSAEGHGGHVAVLRIDESSWHSASSESRIDAGGSNDVRDT